MTADNELFVGILLFCDFGQLAGITDDVFCAVFVAEISHSVTVLYGFSVTCHIVHKYSIAQIGKGLDKVFVPAAVLCHSVMHLDNRFDILIIGTPLPRPDFAVAGTARIHIFFCFHNI